MKEIKPLIPIAVLLLFIASLGAYAWFNQEEELTILHMFPPDIPIPHSLDELLVHTTDIIRVEILPDKWYKSSIRGTIFTLNSAKVTEVFKGNTQVGDIIDVAQPGGRRGNVMLFMPGSTTLEPGEDLVLFLWLMGQSVFDRENVFSFPNHASISTYRFPASSGESGSLNEDFELEGGGRFITLTVGDLRRIANESFGAVPE